MGIPRTAPFDFARLFVTENERLLELLRSLTPAEWSRPTPCPGWDVLALSTHLLGGSLSVISYLRDGHRGTSSPADADEQTFIGWLDNLQTVWTDGARRLSPRLTIELLEWVEQGFSEAIAAQDPAELSAHVSWASAEPVPVWLDHAREHTEKWIHQQQVRINTSTAKPHVGRISAKIFEHLGSASLR
jgi:uncharacterized protein (TIGR03083 family)